MWTPSPGFSQLLQLSFPLAPPSCQPLTLTCRDRQPTRPPAGNPLGVEDKLILFFSLLSPAARGSATFKWINEKGERRVEPSSHCQAIVFRPTATSNLVRFQQQWVQSVLSSPLVFAPTYKLKNRNFQPQQQHNPFAVLRDRFVAQTVEFPRPALVVETC